ncbi:tRNA-specific adenosine deaminase 1, partial [Elysia marginata]
MAAEPNIEELSSHTGLADHVANCALEAYKKLSKRGKPQRLKEWTLLSAVVMKKQDENQIHFKTVSLATGSKCIGKSKMSPQDLECMAHSIRLSNSLDCFILKPKRR